ncbi:hypothetical protein OWV82_016465 [Melia azedarach]|uniref:Uncharacterized protein n=1 Tax=Melia azedarach TaxID=155640 RepID=A0ACC1XFR4_MELAZ|nr:hypothetical protein OWV82_016465 [Melia azedarach]
METKHLILLALMILQLILSQTSCMAMVPDQVDVSDESSSQQFSREFGLVSKRVSPAPPPPKPNGPVIPKPPVKPPRPPPPPPPHSPNGSATVKPPISPQPPPPTPTPNGPATPKPPNRPQVPPLPTQY